MDKTTFFIASLLFYGLTGCFPFNEDDWPERRRDSSYLDYIKAREQEYEDALRLRDAFQPDEDGYLSPDDESYYDDTDIDRDDGRRDSEDDNDEDEVDERQDKGRRNSDRIEKLKHEINDVNSPNHIAKSHKDSQKKASLKSQKKKSDYIGRKKEKVAQKKQKDEMLFKEREAHSAQKLQLKKDNAGKEKDISSSKKVDASKKTEVHVIEHDNLNEYGQVSKAQNDDKQKSVKDISRKDGVTSNDGTKSVNKSSTTNKPATLPEPKKIANKRNTKKLDKALFIVVVAACSVAGVAGLILAGYCWYRLRAEEEEAPEEDTKKYAKKKKKSRKPELTNDEKLAKSAEVFHYMHTKKQLAAMEKSGTEKKTSVVDDSDSSDGESDNTVYECPGLAPPGDMKVVNPLFSDTEKDHSDARSDGSHVSSPTRENSPPKSEQKNK